MKQETIVIPGELPDMNEIIKVSKSHHMKYSSMKKQYTDLVTWLAKGKGPFRKIDIEVKWYCKNKKKDKDNICVGLKFVLDGLVNAGVIENDGWRQVNDLTHRFRVDKENPRVEVLIKECERGVQEMKQGKKPTVAQRSLIESKKLNSRNWLVTKDTPDFIELINRESHKVRKYSK